MNINLFKNKILIIVQARCGSKRLKGKVLKKINNKSILEIIIKRIKKSKFSQKLVVATTKKKDDKKIINLCKKIKVDCISGDEINVLKRFYFVAKKYNAENIVRITADCPMVDFKLLDKMIKKFFSKKVQYLSNTLKPTFPHGLDIEIFNFTVLQKAYSNVTRKYDKEHVTPYIKRTKSIKKFNYVNNKNLSGIRLTLDYNEDFQIIKKIYKYFHPKIYFTLNDMEELYKLKKEYFYFKSKTKINLMKKKDPSLNRINTELIV